MSGVDDDLTTDAVPSPPRDEIKNENQDQKYEETVINEEPRVKTKAKVRKPKKIGPTAYASVINISNATGIHIGSNINMFCNSNKKDTSTDKDYIITDSIKTLLKSTEPVERKHLIFLAPHLNEDWRNTARLLNYSDGQISQFYEDFNRIGIKEVIYQLLLDWIQNEPDIATIGKLSKTLWDTNQQDAVIRWSENLKLSNGAL